MLPRTRKTSFKDMDKHCACLSVFTMDFQPGGQAYKFLHLPDDFFAWDTLSNHCIQFQPALAYIFIEVNHVPNIIRKLLFRKPNEMCPGPPILVFTVSAAQ